MMKCGERDAHTELLGHRLTTVGKIGNNSEFHMNLKLTLFCILSSIMLCLPLNFSKPDNGA